MGRVSAFLGMVVKRTVECLYGIWSEFDKVVADHGTIMWPNGADLCPDEVYDISEKVEMAT